MNDKDFDYIRDLYKRFEGLTGSQEADAILLLAVVLKEALEPQNTWAEHQDMKRELNEQEAQVSQGG